MSNFTPAFYASPIRYCLWAAREHPALFWSCIIGSAGPVTVLTVPPTLKFLGYERAKPIPMTYPGAAKTMQDKTAPGGRTC
ncbi:NADH-ubiquinone oxidoreductase 9.5 kDa subunit [Xylaria castorea]|nr:NADH-ubiquinone oxidoreductase 9.5 kDa subunit [Xylaria castorea]